MTQQQQHPKPDINKRFSPRQGWNLATGVTAVLSEPFSPFLVVPGTSGELARGVHAVVGTFGYTLYLGGENPQLGGAYFWATMGGFALQAAAGAIWRHPETHSTTEGDSILQRVMEGMTGREFDTLTVKGVWEPAILAGAAYFATPHSPALGRILALGASSRAFQAFACGLKVKAEQRSMRDARAEFARITGRRPMSTPGATASGHAKPGRVFAKRVIGVCILIFAWLAYTGQMEYQIEGVGILFSRLKDLAAGREIQFKPDRPQTYRVPDPGAMRDEAKTERLRRWRAYNRANGFY